MTCTHTSVLTVDCQFCVGGRFKLRFVCFMLHRYLVYIAFLCYFLSSVLAMRLALNDLPKMTYLCWRKTVLVIHLLTSCCIVMGTSVCLSTHITRKPRGRTSPNFLCMLPVAVAQLFSDCVAIRYVFPVLRMTSWARIKHDVMFWSLPGGGTGWTSRQLQCLVEFIWMRHRDEICYLWLTCSL